MENLITRILARAAALALPVLLVFSLLCPTVPKAAQNTAAAMQLTKTEGDVNIQDGAGKSVKARNSLRLYDGYSASTAGASYAWINLDDQKLVKLDESSAAGIKKSGKNLEVYLKEGKLFFNVAKPLEDDESLNIRTSTLLVGIRGTSGWFDLTGEDEGVVSVLEGNVEVTLTDLVTGQSKTDTVSGGESVTCRIYEQNKPEDKCDIIRQDFAKDDIDGFVLVELAKDKNLIQKIYEKTDTKIDLRDITEAEAEERLIADQAAARTGDSKNGAAKTESAQTVKGAGTAKTAAPASGANTPVTAGGALAKTTTGASYFAAQNSAQSSTLNTYQSNAGGAQYMQNQWSASSSGEGSVSSQSARPGAATQPGSTTTQPGGAVTPPPSGSSDADDDFPDISLPPGNGPTVSLPPAQSKVVLTSATASEIEAYLNDGKEVVLNGPLSLNEPLTVPAGGKLTVNGAVTIASQGELTVMGTVNANSGLTNSGSLSLGAAPQTRGNFAFIGFLTGPTLNVTGTLESGSEMQLGKTAVLTADNINSKLKIEPGAQVYYTGTREGEVALAGGFDKLWAGNMVTITQAQPGSPGGEVKFLGYTGYKLDSSDGKLTLEGNTALPDYSGTDTRPWKDKLQDVKSVVIGNGIVSINNNMFFGCTKLASVNIPDSVTEIAANAFVNCSSLTSLTIPKNVKSIGKTAFSGCTGISNITMPEGVIQIGEQAFNGCTSLTNVVIPKSVTSIGTDAFLGCQTGINIYFTGSQADWDKATNGANVLPDGVFVQCDYVPKAAPANSAEPASLTHSQGLSVQVEVDAQNAVPQSEEAVLSAGETATETAEIVTKLASDDTAESALPEDSPSLNEKTPGTGETPGNGTVAEPNSTVENSGDGSEKTGASSENNVGVSGDTYGQPSGGNTGVALPPAQDANSGAANTPTDAQDQNSNTSSGASGDISAETPDAGATTGKPVGDSSVEDTTASTNSNAAPSKSDNGQTGAPGDNTNAQTSADGATAAVPPKKPEPAPLPSPSPDPEE